MPKIIPIELIYQSYANITPISLGGIEVRQMDGFTSDDKTTHLIYKPFFLYLSSEDPQIDGSILGINADVAFFFKTVEEACKFYTNFLEMLTTNYFGCYV